MVKVNRIIFFIEVFVSQLLVHRVICPLKKVWG